MINVPAPGRFAIHKCAISQKRGTAAAAKIRKDLSQAEQVFEALLDVRPTDITLALRAAGKRNAAFRERVNAGIEQLNPAIASEIQKLK
jgi:hypothetical protein